VLTDEPSREARATCDGWSSVLLRVVLMVLLVVLVVLAVTLVVTLSVILAVILAHRGRLVTFTPPRRPAGR
jgi:hypothetical protein